MPKHYVYRMTHDTGFAPNVKYGLCTLAGCKKTTIEKWAQAGSWVMGIGGNDTGKANRLIYAMQVQENSLYSEFKRKKPRKAKYLTKSTAGTNVLVSKRFYYFGDQAIKLPGNLRQIIINGRGSKLVKQVDINRLRTYLNQRYRPGVRGKPITPIENYCKKTICKPKRRRRLKGRGTYRS